MSSTSRLALMVAGLLALPIAAGMAQQNNPPGTGGATLKSTTPGDPNNARTSGAASTGSGGATLKTETMGDTGKKVVPSSNQASSGSPGKQSQ